MIRVLTCLLASVAVLSVGVLESFARPNYSGRWVLNVEESYLGPLFNRTSLIREITHDDPRLVIAIESRTSAGKQTGEVRLLTQGEEAVFTIAGVETTGHARWFGDHLMLSTTHMIDGVDTQLDELWTLSEDGKTLRIDAVIITSKGSEELLGIFEKQ